MSTGLRHLPPWLRWPLAAVVGVAAVVFVAGLIAGIVDPPADDPNPRSAQVETVTQTEREVVTVTEQTRPGPRASKKRLPRTRPRPQPTERDLPQAAQEAGVTCGLFSRSKIAADLGLKTTDPDALATRFARDYAAGIRPQVFEACRRAILERKP